MSKKFEELTEPEKALRSLIYAVETKDLWHPAHPRPLGEEYLQVKLNEAKFIAKKAGIELVDVTNDIKNSKK